MAQPVKREPRSSGPATAGRNTGSPKVVAQYASAGPHKISVWGSTPTSRRYFLRRRAKSPGGTPPSSGANVPEGRSPPPPPTSARRVRDHGSLSRRRLSWPWPPPHRALTGVALRAFGDQHRVDGDERPRSWRGRAGDDFPASKNPSASVSLPSSWALTQPGTDDPKDLWPSEADGAPFLAPFGPQKWVWAGQFDMYDEGRLPRNVPVGHGSYRPERRRECRLDGRPAGPFAHGRWHCGVLTPSVSSQVRRAQHAEGERPGGIRTSRSWRSTRRASNFRNWRLSRTTAVGVESRRLGRVGTTASHDRQVPEAVDRLHPGGQVADRRRRRSYGDIDGLAEPEKQVLHEGSFAAQEQKAEPRSAGSPLEIPIKVPGRGFGDHLDEIAPVRCGAGAPEYRQLKNCASE